MGLGIRVVGVITFVASSSAIVAACGSDSSTFPPGGENGPGAGFDGSFLGDGGGGSLRDTIDPNAFWANDPPPKWCGPDAGAPIPPTPGGTVECPTDKNRQGCPCTKAGETAPCWPGLRANRNLGVCKDGVTTCQMRNEFELNWGPCQGYVLPDPNATKGKAACKCFSAGEWAIKNVSPCAYTATVNNTKYEFLISTRASDAQCPAVDLNKPLPPPAPTESFSSNTLKVDCQGHFKLCFTIKAGDPKNRQSTDCVITKVCTEGDYPVVNQVTPFPDLPGWVNSNPTCFKDFHDKGAYAELSVKGQSWLCEAVDDGKGGEYIFQTLTYCPPDCAPNSTLPKCQNCQNGATGQF